MQDKKQTSQAGFTLLETSIAMVLLAIVGLGVAGLFAYAASNTSNAADREWRRPWPSKQWNNSRAWRSPTLR
jgi:prepilin-type N-terminal cleavage/methylation domain-containing protein